MEKVNFVKLNTSEVGSAIKDWLLRKGISPVDKGGVSIQFNMQDGLIKTVQVEIED
ncbi:MAG: hypothetical protein ABF497_05300 [Sporolactobacillus sp.]